VYCGGGNGYFHIDLPATEVINMLKIDNDTRQLLADARRERLGGM